MKVYLYQGGTRIVAKSGIGQAVNHQKKVLDQPGIELVDSFRDNPEVIHINTIFPDSFVAALFAKWKGIKIIYYAHSTMEDFKNSFCGSNLLAPLFRRWICFCYSLGDVVITPTPYSRRILLRYGLKRPVYHLSNGVDTRFFRPDENCGQRFRARYHIADDEKVVISAGHMIERKGILDYIELAKQMPDVRFFWFGYTQKRLIPSHIRQAVEMAPSNLTFGGYVSQDQLRDAYCGADVFAFLSKEETEGIVVLEALACGIPTVLWDIPVYEGWLNHGKQVYKVRSVEECRKKIDRICSGEASELRKYGRKTAELRSLKEIGRKLKRIYQKEGLWKM